MAKRCGSGVSSKRTGSLETEFLAMGRRTSVEYERDTQRTAAALQTCIKQYLNLVFSSMEPRKPIREKASDSLSARHESKLSEALANGAQTLRCIDELQEIKTEETGAPSVNVTTARSSILHTAVNLAAESAGEDIDKARKILSDYGFPPELGEENEEVPEITDKD